MYYIFPLYFVIYNFLIFNNVKNSENYIFLKIFFKTFARKLCFINLLQICEKPFSIAICNEPFSVANLQGTVFRCKFAWKRFSSHGNVFPRKFVRELRVFFICEHGFATKMFPSQFPCKSQFARELREFLPLQQTCFFVVTPLA